VTGYDALDKHIAKTEARKPSLLVVLDHPEIPLHNNPAELGARRQVRKRKISLGTRTEDGTKARDTFSNSHFDSFDNGKFDVRLVVSHVA